MTIFTVFAQDIHSEEESMKAFTDKWGAWDWIDEDIDKVEAILREDGYDPECHAEADEMFFAVVVPNTDIRYTWTVFECELN